MGCYREVRPALLPRLAHSDAALQKPLADRRKTTLYGPVPDGHGTSELEDVRKTAVPGARA
eukprot:1083009-Lingulodinium_polyedra.AAC.1